MSAAQVSLNYFGVFFYFLWGAFNYFLSEIDYHDPVAYFQYLHVMLNQYYRDPQLRCSFYRLDGILDFIGVHPRNRLIEQQQIGFNR